jgi:hypothetical protein
MIQMTQQTKYQSQDCPCGEFSLPAGGELLLEIFYGDGESQTRTLIHDRSVIIQKQQLFKTASDYFIFDDPVEVKKVILSKTNGFFILNNVVKFRLLEFPLNIPLYVDFLGDVGYTTNFGQTISIDIPKRNSPSLPKKFSYILEFTSLCDFGKDYDPCCDSLPSSLPIDGYLNICIPLSRHYDLAQINPVTTTTLPPRFIGNQCT